MRIPSLLLVVGCLAAMAEDSPLILADRAAIERIYHDRRLGTKAPFDEAMPAALLERMVRADRHKESVLRQVYGAEVTLAMVEAEVQRINATTRAPEVLAEIKRALGDDPVRFSRSIARPVVVERILRQRFDDDGALHAPGRAAAESARQRLLANDAVQGMQESTWLLEPRPTGENPPTPATPQAERTASTSGSYSNEATAEVATPLGGAEGSPDARKHYFAELDPELQNVLRLQLQKAGDVTAVIETPAAFLVFVAKEKSATALTTACLTVSKRSYDEWLAQQPASGNPP